jgi:hypothetical protein
MHANTYTLPPFGAAAATTSPEDAMHDMDMSLEHSANCLCPLVWDPPPPLP